MSKYKVTRWMQASIPVVSYVEANSSEEAEEESSTAPYNYDYGNSVIGDIEDTEVEAVTEEIDELKEDCSCGHGSDCDCGPECGCGCNAVEEAEEITRLKHLINFRT